MLQFTASPLPTPRSGMPKKLKKERQPLRGHLQLNIHAGNVARRRRRQQSRYRNAPQLFWFLCKETRKPGSRQAGANSIAYRALPAAKTTALLLRSQPRKSGVQEANAASHGYMLQLSRSVRTDASRPPAAGTNTALVLPFLLRRFNIRPQVSAITAPSTRPEPSHVGTSRSRMIGRGQPASAEKKTDRQTYGQDRDVRTQGRSDLATSWYKRGSCQRRAPLL
jgi:hypothetical protein